MNRYALIKDNIVENLVMLEVEDISWMQDDWDHIVESLTAEMGDSYDPATEEFTSNLVPEVWPTIRTMTIEKWFDRWTDEELGIFETLAQTNEAIAGWRVWISRQSAVDLDDTRITNRLAQGVSSGRITQARMDALLADVAENEL